MDDVSLTVKRQAYLNVVQESAMCIYHGFTSTVINGNALIDFSCGFVSNTAAIYEFIISNLKYWNF
jgi:hypothetical protein